MTQHFFAWTVNAGKAFGTLSDEPNEDAFYAQYSVLTSLPPAEKSEVDSGIGALLGRGQQAKTKQNKSEREQRDNSRTHEI